MRGSIRSWKPRDLSNIRGIGQRATNTARKIIGPAQPTGIHRAQGAQRALIVRPRNSRVERDAKRYAHYKKKLMLRYDTNEYVRREQLTNYQHHSEHGKIGSQGFRRFTTVKGIPYNRDLSPHQITQDKRRQYAYQNEFTGWIRDSAKQNVFRWKRDDGAHRGGSRTNITAFHFRKKQPVVSQITGK